MTPHGRQTFLCTCVRNVQTELQTASAATSVDNMTINWSAMWRCERYCNLVRMLGPMWRTHESRGRRRVQQRSGLCPRQLSSIRLYKRGGVRIVGALLLTLASSSGWAGFNVAAAATVKIGYLMDWGLRSPLYPAAAAAAARAAAADLAKSGVLPLEDSVEWVWHDSACDTIAAHNAAEVLLDRYGVDLLVGPACCAAASRASVLADARGVPLISWGCSANYMSDKVLYPSFLRVVGSDTEFALAVGALFRRHGWMAASILFSGGSSRGLVYSSLAQQMRRVLEEQGTRINAWRETDGTESCAWSAGEAPSARAAVDAAVPLSGRSDYPHGQPVVIVLGECADYRQVMTYAASRGFVSDRKWILLTASRDPECHRSARACGRDDGRDALALESFAESISMDWSAMQTSRANAAKYAEAAAAHLRGEFAADFVPPPKGNAFPVYGHNSNSPENAVHMRYLEKSHDTEGDLGNGLLNSLPIAMGDRKSITGSSTEVDGGAATGSARIDPCHEGDALHREASGTNGPGPLAGSIQSDCEDSGFTSLDGVFGRDQYSPVPDAAPAEMFSSAALLFDAVELGGRLLAAASRAGWGRRKGSESTSWTSQRPGWTDLASNVSFEGLSGQVELDKLGNRKAMDIAFWELESSALGGVSYLVGKEVARYESRKGDITLLGETQWNQGDSNTAHEKLAGTVSPMYPAVRLVEVKAAEGPGEFILVHEAVSSPVLLAVALLIPILLVAAAALRILSQRRAVTGIGTRYSISMGEDQGKGVSTVATASVAEGFEPLKPLHAGNGDNRGLEIPTMQQVAEVDTERSGRAQERLQPQQRLSMTRGIDGFDPGGEGSNRGRPLASIDTGDLACDFDNGGRVIGSGASSRSTVSTNTTVSTRAKQIAEASRGPTERVSVSLGVIVRDIPSGASNSLKERALSSAISDASEFSSTTTATVCTAVLQPLEPGAGSTTTESRGAIDSDVGNTSPARDQFCELNSVEELIEEVADAELEGSGVDVFDRGSRVDSAGSETHDVIMADTGQEADDVELERGSGVASGSAHVDQTQPTVATADLVSHAESSGRPQSAGLQAHPAGVIPSRYRNPPLEAEGPDAVSSSPFCMPPIQPWLANSMADIVSTCPPTPSTTMGGVVDGMVGQDIMASMGCRGNFQGGMGGGGEIGDAEYEFPAFPPTPEDRSNVVCDELQQLGVRATHALEQVEIDARDIVFGPVVGRGSFAEVSIGRLKIRRHDFAVGSSRGKLDGRVDEIAHMELSKTEVTMEKRALPAVLAGDAKVAVKIIRDVSRQSLRRFWSEVLIMKVKSSYDNDENVFTVGLWILTLPQDLDHPNIVRLLGATWRGHRLMMIVDYVERGNLAKVLEEGPRLEWKDQKLDMCLDIAKGMAYLHRFQYFNELSNTMQNCVIHRDLKPENLLVTHDFRVKITDFGEATGKGDDAARTQVGTLLYIAPEIVRGDWYDERCDVYSFAVVLLAMLELRENVITLFREEFKLRERDKEHGPRSQQLTHITITNSIVNEDLRPTLPPDVYETLKILIEQCWDPAPALRPTFDEILEYLSTIAREDIMESIEELPDPIMDPSNVGPGGSSKGVGTDVAAPHPKDVSKKGKSEVLSFLRRHRSSHVGSKGNTRRVTLGDQSPKSSFRPAKIIGDKSVQARGRKRGKNYFPVKGNTAMEFLEKHKEFMRWREDAPSTIQEEELETEDESQVILRSNPFPLTLHRGISLEELKGELEGSSSGHGASGAQGGNIGVREISADGSNRMTHLSNGESQAEDSAYMKQLSSSYDDRASLIPESESEGSDEIPARPRRPASWGGSVFRRQSILAWNDNASGSPLEILRQQISRGASESWEPAGVLQRDEGAPFEEGAVASSGSDRITSPRADVLLDDGGPMSSSEPCGGESPREGIEPACSPQGAQEVLEGAADTNEPEDECHIGQVTSAPDFPQCMAGTRVSPSRCTVSDWVGADCREEEAEVPEDDEERDGNGTVEEKQRLDGSANGYE